MMISQIIHKHKAPSFLQCFTQFLRSKDVAARQPVLSDTLSVYRQFTIECPAMSAVSPNPHRMKIRAIPASICGQKSNPDHFDTILVNVGSGENVEAGSLIGITYEILILSLDVLTESLFRSSSCQSQSDL
jgi:hypothetical protein